MNIKKHLLQVLLISSLILLVACAPESASEDSQEPAMIEEVSEPEGEQEKPLQSGAVEDPYPAPEEKDVVQPGDSEEPYPAPQESIADDPANKNPYPPVEVVGSASNLDLKGALTAADFVVVSSDQNLQASTVFIEHSEIVLKESDPVQVELVLAGQLPSPCNKLRVVASEPDQTGHIKVKAYSVSDPDKTCIQVLEPFIAVVPLGEYTQGTFTLSINNEMNGEFKIP